MVDASDRPTLSRRQALGALAGALAGTAFSPRAAAANARRRQPNIIFILADDLGYGDLGCYGQRTIATPRLDRMAAEGVRFTQCYAGSTVCAPSRSCLMTGQHTGHTTIRGNKRVPLRQEDTTVAEVLRNAGYATGLVGKWGLGEPGTSGAPDRQGFDEYFGYTDQGHAHNYYPEWLWRNGEREPLPGNRHGFRHTHSHELFTREGLDFVRRHAEGPFFLYLAYTVPHANNERGKETGDGMEMPGYGDYAHRAWPSPQKGHAAMISRLDADVGRLLDGLAALGLDDDTLVFFSSDNGPHKEGGADPEFFDSNGELRGIKRALYEGGIRVPMIVRAPGRIEAGRVSAQPWAFWDFLPTAAELAGATAPDGLDGLSMVGALTGRSQRQHPWLYWEFHEGGFHQAVRMGAWKAVRHGVDGPIELYHLGRDPSETQNLAADYPAIVEACATAMAAARTDSEDWPLP